MFRPYHVFRPHFGRPMPPPGVRERFFLGGGGINVDMPSDCQNLGGGHRHIHPLETKSWGGIAPLPPPRLPRPCPPPFPRPWSHPLEVRSQCRLRDTTWIWPMPERIDDHNNYFVFLNQYDGSRRISYRGE